MTIYIQNPKQSTTNKLLGIINDFRKIMGLKENVKKFHVLAMNEQIKMTFKITQKSETLRYKSKKVSVK
jgi:hypothetical protein